MFQQPFKSQKPLFDTQLEANPGQLEVIMLNKAKYPEFLVKYFLFLLPFIIDGYILSLFKGMSMSTSSGRTTADSNLAKISISFIILKKP